MKPFHRYANQFTYLPKEDVYEFIASLWCLDPSFLPTTDLEGRIPDLLRAWLGDDDSMLRVIVDANDARALRVFLLNIQPPVQPLHDAIFHGSYLKVFTVPERRRGDDDYFEHLAAMWKPSPEADPLFELNALRSKVYEERLQKGLDSAFIGEGADIFEQGFLEYQRYWLERNNVLYGRMIGVVAPSGMGKTKMTLEYLSKNPGVYLPPKSR
ncbi:hypothetical protein MVEN_01363300 [Mycena venus]|uniref:Uncharacterized protein n=1 Tax=Mycena venus TaxID=2733690 RepID=A0A8H7CUA1_9AGAR|nr:hypothetical protein MVEN_01363300 [Mycena venus]